MRSIESTLVGTDLGVLVAGSALVALGASLLVAAVMLYGRRRRRPTTAAETVAPTPPTIDLTDETADRAVAATSATTSVDLSQLDRRLEDVERQMVRLADRLDEVIRHRMRASVPERTPASKPAMRREPTRDEAPTASPEEISLRALVARSR